MNTRNLHSFIPNHTLRSRRGVAVLVVAVLAAAMALAACGSDSSSSSTTATTAGASSAGPVVSDPWARASASGQTNGAAYMILEGGSESDMLISASSPSGVAAKVELHETVTSGGGEMTDDTAGGMGGMDGMDGSTSGMMSMREVASIPVPAGEQVMLEPGGYHIMLIDLTAPLVVGESIELALQFEKAGTVMVTAEVRA